MAKVTSGPRVTIPKSIARRYEIRPGDEIDWIPAGDSIGLVKRNRRRKAVDVAERLRLFDEATERHRRRQAVPTPDGEPEDRGWKREDRY